MPICCDTGRAAIALDRGGAWWPWARDQFAALLPVLDPVSGPEHPDTLAARGYLAHWIRLADGGAATDIPDVS